MEFLYGRQHCIGWELWRERILLRSGVSVEKETLLEGSPENPVAKWGFCRKGNTEGRESCREENPIAKWVFCTVEKATLYVKRAL